jgi:hypothetical protein
VVCVFAAVAVGFVIVVGAVKRVGELTRDVPLTDGPERIPPPAPNAVADRAMAQIAVAITRGFTSMFIQSSYTHVYQVPETTST